MMAHLLVVILEDLTRLPDLMASWKRIGVPGVTLLQSLGGFHAESWLHRMGLGGISRIFEQVELRQRMLLSLIEGDDLLEQAIAEADEVVGGFDRPHSGILFSIPVGQALGLRKWTQDEILRSKRMEGKGLESAGLRLTTPVSEIINVLSLDPAIVSPEASLQEVVAELLAHPNVQVVCVQNEEKHLVGLIDMINLSNALFQEIFPEEYLGELTDLEEVLRYADRTRIRTAADIMQEPASVRMQGNLQAAFHIVHQRGLPGIPVVDDQYHIIGYINLLELMVGCLRSIENRREEAGGEA
ncbi:MAG TPA: CBS domain-containing protein [Anaerolineales bacterium]|nr:CBS domain-containing protein [Anaerolineales bacterium]